MRRVTMDKATRSIPLGCVWCGGSVRPWERRTFQGSVHVCVCGARVLLAPPQDFDEAAEELLAALRLAGTVARPAEPVGTSGMLFARPYDAAGSRRELAEVLRAAGSETQTEELEVGYPSLDGVRVHFTTIWALWWRAARG